MPHAHLRGILLLGLALILGFALMGFEMLGSRYLYPYFGGGQGNLGNARMVKKVT